MKSLKAALVLLPLCSCAHLRSPFKSELSQSPVRVRELGSQDLGQGVFKDSAPPESSIAPIFLEDDGLLLVTMGGAIEFRDLKTMAVRWRIPLGIGVSAQPLVLGSSVLVADMSAVIRKIRFSTGQVEWTAKLPAESSGGVAASHGVIFVTASDDSLSALDERTGANIWSYKRPAHESNVLWSLKGNAIPVISPDGKTVYAGFSDGAFVALETSSGKTTWERSFDRPGRFKDADTPPILSEDGSVIYLSVVDGDLVSLRTRDGSTLWSISGASSTPPLVRPADKAVYLSTRDGKVEKISLEDNHVIWATSLGNRGLGSLPVAMLDSFLAVTTTNAGLVLLDKATGKLLWESDYAIGTVAPPAFDGRRLAVISARNWLHLYSIEKRM